MKRIILVIIIFFGGVSVVKAQHCPFDGALILVSEIYSDTDSIVIPNLQVTLLDTLENVVLEQKMKDEVWKTDTLKFWQNPKESKHSGIIDNIRPENPWTLHFWFAADNYVFITGNKLRISKIKIEDIDGNENGGDFQTQIINLTKNDFYPLCTGISQWDLGEKYGFVKDYKPIRVELKKK